MVFGISTQDNSVKLPLLLSVISCLGILHITTTIRRNKTKKPPLPPGPPRHFLWGNLFDFPTAGFDWEIYAKWGEEFKSSLISLSSPAGTVIVINSYEKAMEMIERKGQIYSSRPYTPMLSEPQLMNCNKIFSTLEYGPRLRAYRKLFHHHLGNAKAAATHGLTQEIFARRFIRLLLKNKPSGKGLQDLAHLHAGGIILQIAYGYTPREENDPFIENAMDFEKAFIAAASPAQFLVNQLPILRFIPEWFPGASFKKMAREWRPTFDHVVDPPFDYVKTNIAAGTAQESLTATVLKNPLSPEEEDDLKYVVGILFSAGAETTAIPILYFFMSMLLYPSIQEKLHLEIDSIINSNHLPNIGDRPDLPYLDAVLKETYRLYPAVPYGLPHCTTEEDVHDGYYIPKGAAVVANIWKMGRDSNVYTSPDEFRPERFMGDNPEQDPNDLIWGFGRRSCPAKHLADATVWITAATIISTLNVLRAHDESTGEPIIPDGRANGQLTNSPLPFPCRFVPRSEKRLSIIAEE